MSSRSEQHFHFLFQHPQLRPQTQSASVQAALPLPTASPLLALWRSIQLQLLSSLFLSEVSHHPRCISQDAANSLSAYPGASPARRLRAGRGSSPCPGNSLPLAPSVRAPPWLPVAGSALAAVRHPAQTNLILSAPSHINTQLLNKITAFVLGSWQGTQTLTFPLSQL